jgi:hypothetical protein
MGTGRSFGSIAIFATIVALSTWSGCGSGGSNDQGISFRTLGFVQGDVSTGPQVSVPDTGRCASLFDTTTIPNDTNGDGLLDGGFLGMQNSMFQGINVDHIDLSYHINGSGLAIPNDVFALSVRLGPVTGSEINPTVGTNNLSTAYSQIIIVSPAIFKFINDNSSRLPDLPFTLVASATAVGTADNGDVFRSNRSTYQVNFTALSGGCTQPTPTPGESTVGGTGTTGG